MVWSIVDRATLFYLLLGMLGCGVAVCWWKTRRREYLLGLGVIVSLAIGLYLLTLFVITDRQRLPQIIHEMAQGVVDGKPEAVLKHFAGDFKLGSYTPADFKKYATAIINKREVTDLHLWDFDIEELSRENRKATVAFRVRVESRGDDFFALARTYFVLEDQSWKLRDLKLFNMVANTKEEIRLPGLR